MSNHLGLPARSASKRKAATTAVGGVGHEVITGGRRSRGLVGPGHQLLDAGGRPQVDELGQGVGHPCQRIDGIQFACLEQRSVHCPTFGAQVVARKKTILSAKTDSPFILPMSGKS